MKRNFAQREKGDCGHLEKDEITEQIESWEEFMGSEPIIPLFSNLDGHVFDFLTPKIEVRSKGLSAHRRGSPFKTQWWELEKDRRQKRMKRWTKKTHRRWMKEVDEIADLLASVDFEEEFRPMAGLHPQLMSPFYPLGTIGEGLAYMQGEDIQPHASVATDFVKTVMWKKFANGDFNAEIVDKVELLISSYFALVQAVSLPHFISILMLVIRNIVGQSLCTKVYEIAMELLELDKDTVEPHADTPGWLEVLKECGDNWQLAVTNPSFDKISSLLTMGVTLGICDPMSISIGKMRVFTVEASKEQVKCESLIDAVFQTAIFLCESGLAAWDQQSFSPFLFTTDAARKMDQEYVEVMSLFEYAIPGNLEMVNMTHGDFERRVDELLSQLALARDTLKPGVEKRLMANKYMTLKTKRASYLQTCASGSLRKRPYAFFITGGSSLGKTDVANILVEACGKYNGIDVSNEKRYTYNCTDEYLSGYRSYNTVFRFDDFGNTKSQFVKTSPTEMLVKVINNNPETAVMPDLESKGAVRIEPDFVTVTSNVMDLDATTYSNCPASVLSRGNVHIVPIVKPQFRRPGSTGLDSRKANDFYRNENGVVEQPAIPDLWDVTVYRANIAPSQDSLSKDGRFVKGSQQVFFEVLEHKGRPMKDVPMTTVVDYCLDDTKDFIQAQNDLLERSKGQRMTFCEECNRPEQLCNCARCMKTEKLAKDCLCEQCAYMVKTKKTLDDSSVESDDAVEPHAWLPLTPLGKAVTCMSLTEWRSRMAKSEVKQRWSDLFSSSGSWTAGLLTRGWTNFSHNTLSYVSYLEYVVEESTTEFLVKTVKDISNSRWGKWTTYLPSAWFDNQYVRKAIVSSRVATIHGHYKDVLRGSFFGVTSIPWYSVMALMWYFGWNKTSQTTLLSYTVGNIFWYLAKLYFIREVAEARLVREHDGCPEIFKSVRDGYGQYIVGGAASLAAIYALYQVYKNLSFDTPHATLEPKTVADLEKRDAEVNPWKVPERESVKPMKVCANVKQAQDILRNHIVHVALDKVKCSGVILSSNVVMIPYHVVSLAKEKGRKPDVKMRCLRREDNSANCAFEKLVDLSRVVRVGDHDLCLINVETTGSVRGVLDLFPKEMPKQLDNAVFMGRDKTGKLYEDMVVGCEFMMTQNGVYDNGYFARNLRYFPGLTYRFTNLESSVGMCTAVLVADKKVPYIAGVHLGGKNKDKKFGTGGTPLVGELEEALKLLHSDPTHFQAAQASDDFTLYGKKSFDEGPIHPKSPVHFLEKGNFLVYGPCKGGSTFSSNVVKSCLSDSVEKEFGVKNQWGPPKGKGPDGKSPWHPWRTSLAYSVNPSIGVPESLLEAAIEDYLKPLRAKMKKFPKYYAEDIKKLSRVEIVSGKDGKRFIDQMNMTTSRGFPLSGPKSEDVIFLEPDQEHACPRTFTQEHWDEYERFKTKARRGERGNLVFKASLKDEPTKLTKDKVRVFQAANMTLQLGMREYFLPFARFLSQHPFVSECAVGVNAHSKEMDQMFRHIRKHGKRRGYAGDYSKYDLRMPAQLIYAAFHVLIELSKLCPDYTDEDRDVMRVLATEVACPMTAFNGDLLQFIGSNPSGQNLTAYINSIVNSLLHRCAFFEKMGMSLSFQDYVALITYGDDYAGSVKLWANYNNLDFVDFCARHDMVVTSPDKETVMPRYMDCDAIDFLKRRPRYDSELGVLMGALDESSIFKSLHCNLKSKTETPENVAASTCSSALCEWFLHGRAVYEDRVSKLRRVAEETGISARVHGLNWSYEDRKQMWIQKNAVNANAPTGH